jgi:hypothetical protein
VIRAYLIAGIVCAFVVWCDCRTRRIPLWVHPFGFAAICFLPSPHYVSGLLNFLFYLALWGFCRIRLRVTGVGLGDALLVLWLSAFLPVPYAVFAAVFAFAVQLLLRMACSLVPACQVWTLAASAPLAPAIILSHMIFVCASPLLSPYYPFCLS